MWGQKILCRTKSGLNYLRNTSFALSTTTYPVRSHRGKKRHSRHSTLLVWELVVADFMSAKTNQKRKLNLPAVGRACNYHQ